MNNAINEIKKKHSGGNKQQNNRGRRQISEVEDRMAEINESERKKEK